MAGRLNRPLMSFPCVPPVATLTRTVVEAVAAPAGRGMSPGAVAAMTMNMIERTRRISVPPCSSPDHTRLAGSNDPGGGKEWLKRSLSHRAYRETASTEHDRAMKPFVGL